MRTALSVFVAGFLRLNANGLAHPSPFLSVLSPILSFYRLFIKNCGIVAGFLRPNSYSFADPFLFPFLSLSHVLAFYLHVAASVSLPTELRLRNRLLSTECIWLH
jgi:hypothetical protein